MIILLALLVFSTFFFSGVISNHLPEWTNQAQDFCQSLIPPNSYKSIYDGLICGSRLPPSEYKSHLLKTGLFHLLVASGAHLAFIEGTMRFVLRRRFEIAIPFVLFSYALLTGLCPPFLRSLFYWAFRTSSHRLQLGWTPLQSLTLAGFATLLLCNREADLLSLAFSWIAGLAVHIFSASLKERRDLASAVVFQLSIYALMIPPTLALSLPHPISIIWNLVLGPLLTLILFPAALLKLLLPLPWGFLPDTAVAFSAWIVRKAAVVTPESYAKTQLSPIWIWLYLFSLVVTAQFIEHLQRRRAIE